MIIKDIKQCLSELRTHILFDYNGVQCGIDPISHSHFEMWYGDKGCTVNNIDDVLNKPFFCEKSLTEIINYINNLEL